MHQGAAKGLQPGQAGQHLARELFGMRHQLTHEMAVAAEWGPDVLAGAALTVVDVLRTINNLSVMRAPRSPGPMVWRWCPMVAGARVPSFLPRSQDFRGVADVVVVPGWLARSGPHLSQLAHDATGVVNRLKQV